MFLHVSWCLHSVLSSETVSEASLFSLLKKRDALLEELEYHLSNSFQLQSDLRSNKLLAYRVSTFFPTISARSSAFFATCSFGLLKDFSNNFV